MSRAKPRTNSEDRINDALEIISNPYRRWIITYFISFERDSASLDHLVRLIKVMDRNTDAKSIEVQIHHSDLVKLDLAGIIDYDKRTKMIEYHGDPLIEDIISETGRYEDEFGEYFD